MDSFFTFVFVFVTWRWTVCGLILYLCVCVRDLEIDSMWIDSLPLCLCS